MTLGNFRTQINRGDGRTAPVSVMQRPPTPRPTQKSKCQKNPDSLECLEEQLSALRSAPSGRAFQRVYRTDEHLTPFTQADVGGIAHLEALIKKKRMIC